MHQRLRSQVLRDSLLSFVAPVIVSVYLLAHLYRAAWIPQGTFVVLAAAAIGIGVLAIVVRYRPMIPSVRSAARLVDEKAAGEDRFLTLATVESSSCSQTFHSRLREETGGLLGRVDLRRDFPYEIKGSFYWSVVGSIIAVALFHLLLPLAESISARVAPHQQISQLAEKMAQHPDLTDLARDFQSLAAKLQDPNMALAEKRQLIQELQKEVEKQQKNQEEKASQDLLGEAASTLKGMEQQSGNAQQREQEGSGGSNAPQDGEGQVKESQGSGGDGKGDLAAQQNKEMQQGKTSQADPKEKGENQGGQANHPDKNQAGKEQGKEMTGKTEGGSEEQLGKSRSEG
ncbi:MAG: hypothetical protein ACREQ7_22120, partial [Candidatus Binatia bacterium]